MPWRQQYLGVLNLIQVTVNLLNLGAAIFRGIKPKANN